MVQSIVSNPIWITIILASQAYVGTTPCGPNHKKVGLLIALFTFAAGFFWRGSAAWQAEPEA